MKRGGFRLRRETSAQSAARFLELRARRRHPRIGYCCARYAFGDGTHDLHCEKYVQEIDNP